MLQSSWRSTLNPLLQKQILSGLFIETTLQVGANNINHLLQQKQQGWIITDQNAAANIYRSQPFNDTTLTLTSDAIVTITLWVY